MDRFAPSTNTGKYTLHPLERFLMSQLPPFSRPGTVLAASSATFFHCSVPVGIPPRHAPLGSGKQARGRVCRQPQRVVALSPPSTSFLSLSFQMARSSCDGAVPMRPGWISPGKRTPGMCRLCANMPSKFQIALAAAGK
eukprot:748807-Hanusia_phi.AAC.5